MPYQTAEQRRTRRRADTRRVILDATQDLLVEGGLDVFSIRRLAERCGYTAPTIYHHFGDKGGLFDALLEERLETLLRAIKRVPEGLDPVETLRGRALAFVRYGTRNPTHYQLLGVMRDPSREPPRSGEEARVLLEHPWLQLVESGRLAPSSMESAQQSLWALVHGLITLRLARPDHDWAKSLAQDSIDALLRGLVAPQPAPCNGRTRPGKQPR
jgi:AcrR family transcriptional regulator